MKITIFTNDFGIQLPEIKWTNALGRGKTVTENEQIVSLLLENDLPLLSTNDNLGKVYCNVLFDFIRPSIDILQAHFRRLDISNRVSLQNMKHLFFISSASIPNYGNKAGL